MMRTAKRTSYPVRLFAYVILAGGVISTAADFFNRPEFSIPTDMGIVIGNGALILLGLATWAIATSLESVEKRLERIENKSDN
jgi:hypothetical protein